MNLQINLIVFKKDNSTKNIKIVIGNWTIDRINLDFEQMFKIYSNIHITQYVHHICKYCEITLNAKT